MCGRYERCREADGEGGQGGFGRCGVSGWWTIGTGGCVGYGESGTANVGAHAPSGVLGKYARSLPGTSPVVGVRMQWTTGSGTAAKMTRMLEWCKVGFEMREAERQGWLCRCASATSARRCHSAIRKARRMALVKMTAACYYCACTIAHASMVGLGGFSSTSLRLVVRRGTRSCSCRRVWKRISLVAGVLPTTASRAARPVDQTRVYMSNLTIDLGACLSTTANLPIHTHHSVAPDPTNPDHFRSIATVHCASSLRLSAPLRPTPPHRPLGAEGAGDT
jgi:hypothetical protein